jgi:ubiquinol-cytochrome c reductase iron-sulfur subunit
VTVHDSRSGATGGADLPEHVYEGPDDDWTPEQLGGLTRADLERIGAKYDGVEVVHVEPAPEPGSRLEQRAIRQVGLVFTLAGLLAFAFVVVYVGSGWFLPSWDWVHHRSTWSTWFTPILGVTLGLSLAAVGLGLVLFTKKLLPHETAVQVKHDTSLFDRMTTGATVMNTLDRSGLARRKLIIRSFGLLAGGLGLALIVPLGGLLKNPSAGNQLGTTPWRKGVRLLTVGGQPIRPEDQEPGSIQTVFPAVPGGNTAADAATMLFRLRPEQVAAFKPRKGQADFRYGDYVAFSKICTHAGCPVSLYEQETSRILCPCHQSQFLITDAATPVFGPAVRPLPQLPLTVDSDGYFVARSDYIEAVGPTYWNRKRI